MNELDTNLNTLVDAVAKAVLAANRNENLEDALSIRDELHRLPNELITEVLNGVILNLVKVDPEVCRWFILDVFLRNADPEGRADVAERINLLLDDLRSQ
jgi:hypothetical protein